MSKISRSDCIEWLFFVGFVAATIIDVQIAHRWTGYPGTLMAVTGGIMLVCFVPALIVKFILDRIL